MALPGRLWGWQQGRYRNWWLEFHLGNWTWGEGRNQNRSGEGQAAPGSLGIAFNTPETKSGSTICSTWLQHPRRAQRGTSQKVFNKTISKNSISFPEKNSHALKIHFHPQLKWTIKISNDFAERTIPRSFHPQVCKSPNWNSPLSR